MGDVVGGVVGGMGGGMLDFASDPMGKKAMRGGVATQSAMTRDANEHLTRGYQESKGYQEPWQGAGLSALADMQGADFKRDFTADDMQTDPGYAFRMAEANKAMERSAAAKGGLQSGGFMKSLARYNQDAASQEFGNAYNRFNQDRDRRFGRLSQLAGMGQSASNNLSNNAMGYQTAVGNNLMGFGNAAAGAAVASANANNQILQAGVGMASKKMSGGGT
jgi:hypothetical protein